MDIEKLKAENEKLRADVVRLNDLLASYQNVLVPELRAENENLRERIKDARLEGYAKGLGEMSAELEQVKVERDAAVALVHEWEEYGRYLSPMGFTVPPNWKEDLQE